jgi:hypothetical protein
MEPTFDSFPDMQRNVTLLRGIPGNDFFDTVSGSGTIISRTVGLQKESPSEATEAASAEASKFYFHRSITGIKLSHQNPPNLPSSSLHEIK